jgi:hypothetical protein
MGFNGLFAVGVKARQEDSLCNNVLSIEIQRPTGEYG